ncbi:unnamed protein product [Fructobacillus tropaeoli]|uniref:KxYKxGKxW signal peptide domain-containing protein n=1 Tax=Fructobacillus tropaeoli TaxID=709323 RepID=UPI002D85BCCF|nr:unnamed protein product [Fructobacillus tropaeoli]
MKSMVNEKQHIKMFKSGKFWLFSAITSFAIFGGVSNNDLSHGSGLLSPLTAVADDVSNQNSLASTKTDLLQKLQTLKQQEYSQARGVGDYSTAVQQAVIINEINAQTAKVNAADSVGDANAAYASAVANLQGLSVYKQTAENNIRSAINNYENSLPDFASQYSSAQRLRTMFLEVEFNYLCYLIDGAQNRSGVDQVVSTMPFYDDVKKAVTGATPDEPYNQLQTLLDQSMDLSFKMWSEVTNDSNVFDSNAKADMITATTNGIDNAKKIVQDYANDLKQMFDKLYDQSFILPIQLEYKYIEDVTIDQQVQTYLAKVSANTALSPAEVQVKVDAIKNVGVTYKQKINQVFSADDYLNISNQVQPALDAALAVEPSSTSTTPTNSNSTSESATNNSSSATSTSDHSAQSGSTTTSTTPTNTNSTSESATNHGSESVSTSDHSAQSGSATTSTTPTNSNSTSESATNNSSSATSTSNHSAQSGSTTTSTTPTNSNSTSESATNNSSSAASTSDHSAQSGSTTTSTTPTNSNSTSESTTNNGSESASTSDHSAQSGSTTTSTTPTNSNSTSESATNNGSESVSTSDHSAQSGSTTTSTTPTNDNSTSESATNNSSSVTSTSNHSAQSGSATTSTTPANSNSTSESTTNNGSESASTSDQSAQSGSTSTSTIPTSSNSTNESSGSTVLTGRSVANGPQNLVTPAVTANQYGSRTDADSGDVVLPRTATTRVELFDQELAGGVIAAISGFFLLASRKRRQK